MKNRILGILLSAVLALSMLSGCSAKTEASTAAATESQDLLASIKAKGKITVAMEGTWAPWTYHDESGALVGFDVEVAAAIAKELGVEVEYVEGEWDGLLAGVQVGRYDIMVNGVGYTEERAKSYAFSDPYAYNRTALIVRSDNDTIKTMEDLKGKTTCNSAQSTFQLLAEAYGATVKDVETLAGTLEEVLAGRADATLNAEVSFEDYMKEHPDAALKVVCYADDVEKVCIIAPKGDSSNTLMEAINQALKTMADNGTLTELSNKYFGVDITKE